MRSSIPTFSPLLPRGNGKNHPNRGAIFLILLYLVALTAGGYLLVGKAALALPILVRCSMPRVTV